MISLLWNLIKLGIFAVAVLLVANWVEWDGRTLSEHLQKNLTQIETLEPVQKLKNLIGKKEEEAPTKRAKAVSQKRKTKPQDRIYAHEQRRLRDFIRGQQSAPKRKKD